ncbi:radical SAM/SPASM domain-containing protein [Actinomyces israelii]|uniref:radical SAM/SPASM domain-containing protein n=1 Tax=Actinomyces israelii TaxID=1659 RepID=UPI00255518A4|nr:radical SAM protein [Actinomyces israelii]WKR22089.1 Anaerobic sulfatase-maturating enzyme [Actinomyces israelii]
MILLKNGMLYDSGSHRIYRELPSGPSPKKNSDDACAKNMRDRSYSLGSGKARRVVLILTERCNLGCSYCYAGKGAYGKSSLNRIQAQQIDDEVSFLERTFPLGIEHLQFFGGEPLLEIRAIGELCERASNSFSMRESARSIVTNGTVLNESILEVLVSNNISVTVSLDGPAELHDRYRVFKKGGRGSFESIIKNAERMASGGLNLAVQLTVSPATVEAYLEERLNVEAFMDQLVSVGVKYLHLSPVIDIHGGKFAFSQEQFAGLGDLQSRMIAAAHARGLRNNAVAEAYNFLTKRQCNPGYCGAGLDEITIDVNGDLYPCFMLINRSGYRLGTIRDGVTNSALVADLEANRKSCSTVCSRCPIKDVCKSCIGASVIENGSVSRPSRSMCEFLQNNYFFGVNELIESIK